jgi:hypothetical protein
MSDLTVQDVYDSFARAGLPLINVGISGDNIHVDAICSAQDLEAVMARLGLESTGTDDHVTFTRGYFYPPQAMP